MLLSSRHGQGRGRAGGRDRVAALPIVLVLYIAGLAALVALAGRGRGIRGGPRASGDAEAVSRVVTGWDAVMRETAGEAESKDDYHGFCADKSSWLNSGYALFLYIPVVFIMFVGLAIVTDDFFVAALEAICERLSLSEDVAGATFMAAGSSAPELFTSLLAVFVTKDDVGVGTIVGSAVFNILVIIGLSAALAGSVLHLDWRSLARDSFFYVLSIIALLVVLLGPSRGEVTWWEGLCMVAVYGLYIAFMKFGNGPYMRATEKYVSKPGNGEIGDEEAAGSSGDVSRSEDIAEPDSATFSNPDLLARASVPVDFKELNPRAQFRTAYLAVKAANKFKRVASGESLGPGGPPQPSDEFSSSNEEPTPHYVWGIEKPEGKVGMALFPLTFVWSILFKFTIPDCSRPNRGGWWPLTFFFAIFWIGAISYAMVESARKAGCIIGIPSSVMGLTVLAAGTSVPDALASVAVARMGQADMAVSNAIGSNVFDILLGLGFPWFLGALILNKNMEVTVDPLSTVVIPIAILFVIIVALICLLAALRWKLRPLLGYILFGIYVLFVVYQLLDNFVFKFGKPAS